MTISAKYEDGVFKPLEVVKLAEGTVVEVNVPLSLHELIKARTRPIEEFEFCGMWADRTDIGDSVEYVNRLRGNRGAPPEE